MRWFVEVSRVGENGVADEYCVEAKQWQAALQEARKLRGDTGALSKFSIELLDRGYRAVDPSLKLRYLINEAPADAPLTGESSRKNGNRAEATGGKPRVTESLAPSAYATSLAPTPFTTSLAPPATSSPVPRPSSHAAPRPTSVVPARALSAEPPRAAQLVVPDDPVPPAPPVPGSASLPPQSLPSQSPPSQSPPSQSPPSQSPPPQSPPPQSLSPQSPPPQSLSPQSLSLPPLPPRLPSFELVRQRAEEPRPDSPITYREFAYAVEPGRTRDEIEALLRDRYQATLATIEDRPPGKFVQLAVFDHVFKRRPERPPLATFAWKDWRGEPVLAFPGFGEEAMAPMSRVPAAPDSVAPRSNGAATSVPPPALRDSVPVVPMAPVVISSAPPPAQALVAAPVPAPVVEVEIPIDEAAPAPVVEVEIPIDEAAPVPAIEAAIPLASAAPTPAAEAPLPIVEGARAPASVAPLSLASASTSAADVVVPLASVALPPQLEAPMSIVEGARAPVVEVPPSAAAAPAPSFELNFESASSPAVSPVPANPASAERTSRPRIAAEGRRRAGEDLIGELFEIMHELNFAHDVAEGSEFVLSVLNELLPCEGVLIHVFDINTGHFVVVRAKGPNANTVLLQRMSDQDPLVRSVMRSTHATSVKNAAEDARFNGPRWQALGVGPRAALCGGVQLGGRYLGLIEVANPYGDVPFHQSELNALDYICEQFAAFLSKKPIVLSADVVLSRG